MFGVPRMALFCEKWIKMICVTLMYVGVKSEVVLLRPGTFAHGDPCCLHNGPLPSSILIQLPPEARSVSLKMEVIHLPETSEQTFAVWCDNPTYSCHTLL